MTRYIYGGGGDGDIIKPTGVPYINSAALVYNSRSGGSQITDLQNISGGAVTSVLSDAFGQVVFYGPDNYIAPLWLDFGSGVRWALSPKAVDLVATRAVAVQRAADAAGAAFTAKAHLPYNAADPLEQALATALDPTVIPRFASQAARNAAFPAPADGDRCWRTDLSCEQVYSGSQATWRSTQFAANFGGGGTTVAVANTASETSLLSVNIPAGIATAGATFRLTAYGTMIQAASGTPTMLIRARLGGLTGPLFGALSWTAASATLPTARPWDVSVLVNVLTTGVSGTWFGTINGRSAITSTTSLPSTPTAVRQDGIAGLVRDTTVAQSLVLSANWDTASAANNLTLYGWAWERIA